MMRRRILPYSLLALAAVATTGAVVAHRVLDRPGESAFALVPANALGVMSLDLVPSPDQVMAFKNIDRTISAANGGRMDTGSLLSEFFSDPWMQPLVDQVDRSIAVAYLPDPKGKTKDDGGIVAFIALKDPVALQDALAKRGKAARMEGGTFYWLMKGKQQEAAVMVRDGYAIVSDKAWPLLAVSRVARNAAPSIVSDPAFAAARARALDSSNLLVMVSPGIMKNPDWFVASMAVRETGMDFAANGITDDPQFLKGGQLKMLDRSVVDALPRGAYGFMAMSQPGAAVALAGNSLDESAKEIQKNTDLDLRKDILPAFGGNVALGFYPSFGPDAGLDLLVLVDDANGADPADLAKKLEALIDKEMQDNPSGGDWKTALPLPGAEGTTLTDETSVEMQKGIREVERSYFRPLTLSKGKTVAWAKVGDSVLLATSKNLLERAVASKTNPSPALSLSGDAALGMNPAGTSDGQFSLAFSMSRVVEGLRNTIDPSHMTAQDATMYRRMLNLYDGTTEPLAIRAKMDPSGRYDFFYSAPFDWSKLPDYFRK